MTPTHVQITIREFYDKDTARVLHTNMEQIPPGMTVQKAARNLLAKAAENFQEPARRQRRD